MTVFLICLGISLFFFYESQYGISPQGFKVPCSFPAIILRDYYPIVKSLLRVLVSTVGYNSKLEGLNLLKLFLGDVPVSPAIKTLLPMQGARVWSLVRGDSTCWGATMPMCSTACLKPPNKKPAWTATKTQRGET